MNILIGGSLASLALVPVIGFSPLLVLVVLGAWALGSNAAKAASGDMAFAIALEAYTTDDSNGVIDALIIKPRKI